MLPQQDAVGRALLWTAIVLYIVNLVVLAWVYSHASVQ